MATEKRLIDANALKANFVVIGDFAEDLWHTSAIRGAIDNAPTVDAVEVVHGRWEPSESMILSAKCSECKCWVTKHSIDEPDFRYCPNCGADMRGEGNG